METKQFTPLSYAYFLDSYQSSGSLSIFPLFSFSLVNGYNDTVSAEVAHFALHAYIQTSHDCLTINSLPINNIHSFTVHSALDKYFIGALRSMDK